MASRKERHRVLAGAMDMVPPTDKLTLGVSALLDNWRVDINGELQTRGAAATEAGTPGPIGSGIFHTMARTANSRYSGIGTEIYWGPEPAGSKLLASGFDGNPLGIAFYQQFGWVMNRSKQGRLYYNETMHNWGVAPPATAPVAVTGSTPLQPMESYDGTSGLNHVEASTDGINWLVAMNADVPLDASLVAASFDSVTLQEGAASLKLSAVSPMSVLARVNFTPAFDSSVAGIIRDEDALIVYVYASDPKSIKSMTVRLSNLAADGVTESSWVEANLASGSSWDPLKVLSQTPQSWTQLVIRRQLNVDAFQAKIAAAGDQATALSSQLSQLLHQPTLQIVAGGDPQILAANATPANPVSLFDWTKIGRMVISFNLTAACEIHLDNAGFAAGSTASLTGNYQWLVSFFNTVLEDSNPSPISNTLTLNGQSASLTGIPISTDPDARGRYIYRIGGSSSQALRVDTLWDNSTTTWTDPTSDEGAQDLGVTVPIDRGLPPPGRGCMGPHYGRIHAWSSAAHPARLWWTPVGIPWGFKGADDPDIGDWEDVGADDDEIVNSTDHKQLQVIYKQRSIWRVNGDVGLKGVDPVKTNSNIGLVGPKAVVNGGAVDYFGGAEGVYVFNGDFETKISGALDPIFKGQFAQLSSGDLIPPMDKINVGNCVISLINDRLRYCYPEAGQTQPNVVLIHDLSTGGWAREKYNGLASPAFTAMNYEGPGRWLCGGSTATDGARLYNLELLDFRADNGASFHAVWQSRAEDQGLPDIRKVYSDFEITFQTGWGGSGTAGGPAVSTLSVYMVFDKFTKVLIGTVSSATETTKILRIYGANGTDYGYTAKNCAIRVEGDILAIARIFGTYLHWYPEERTADTFDSGPTDLGIPERVKEADYIEFYTTAGAQQMTRILSSDLPGSVLLARDTTNFTAPNGRGNTRQRLAAPIDGRNFRLVVANTPTGSLFQMHQARIRARVIGEYIDGTIGEYYESPEFSVAPGRVGELKDFLLDYDVSAAGGRVEIYSDLPGHSFALRRTLAIPFQSGRAIYVFPLEDVADSTSDQLPCGQLFKVRLYPPVGGILRLHGRAAFRARLIGVYFEGANGEVWETQDLDLLGGMGIFRQVYIDGETSGPMTFEMYCELPTQNMRLQASMIIDSSATSPRRLPIYARLPGNTKGHQQRFRIRGAATMRLYKLRVLARRLEVNGGAWDWVDVPFERTPDEWASIQMPIRETPEAFTWIDLPVDAIE
jgi:hypothetical protein